MRLVVVVVSAVAALAFIVASGLMNWVFMTSLGKSGFEKQIFGSVSVAVSAFIALLPTLILWAYRDSRFVQVVVGIPVFLAFIAFSLSSAVGFSAKNRGGMAEDRTLATSHLEDARRDIADAETKRKALGGARPAGVVQEALRGMEQDVNWRWSRQCENATTAGERTFCKSYFDTKAEGVRAVELAALESKIVGLKAEARSYEAQGAGRQADSQAAVLASLLGMQTIDVEKGLTLSLALLVELGAAAGLYLATGHIRHEPKNARPVVLTVVPEIEPDTVSLKQIEGPKQLRRVPRIRKEK